MVQPRPARGRPLRPLRRRSARPSQLRPRQAPPREGADGGRAGADRGLGPAGRHRRVELRDARGRVRGMGRGELDRRDPLRPELPVRRAVPAAIAGRADRRPVRLGALHRASTWRRRGRPTTSSTRSPAASRIATRAGASRRRGFPGGSTRSCSRCRSAAATTASSGSSSPAASSATASRPSRSSRPSRTHRGENLRLLVKAQVERSRLDVILPLIEADERIELRLADEPWDEHLAAVAANDVSISPSRWEGLGLPLYEAVALGMPTIANDDPPMNEVVHRRRQRHPRPLASRRHGTLGDPGEAARHRRDDGGDRADRRAGRARAPAATAPSPRAGDHRWERTVAGLGELLDR